MIFGWRAATAAALLLSRTISFALADDTDNPVGQSTFISPNDELNFAFTVANNSNEDIYFALRVPTSRSWGAVGLGSDDMPGALYLMIYQNDRGDNVTFSPRLSYGNYEPEWFEGVKYEVLAGTGIFDDHMVFVAKCTESCRSWPSRGTSRGYIDVSSPTSQAIFALGPEESYHSDNVKAPLKMHDIYGTFSIDMKRTMGSGDAPALTEDSENEGTELKTEKKGIFDKKATVHGVFMVLSVVFILPFGVLLKLGGWVRWHGLTQGFALAIVSAGLAMGVVTSYHYQRSRGFTSWHQILGIVLVAVFYAQFALGFLHHRQYSRTQAPTKYGPFHRWIGRFAILIGIFNAFAGFSFALNQRYGMIVAGLIILIGVVFLAVIFWRGYTKKGRRRGVNPLAADPQPYQPQSTPWRQDPAQGSSDAPPGYEAPANQDQIGLQPVSPSPWRRNEGGDKGFDEDPGLGDSAQRPREFA